MTWKITVTIEDDKGRLGRVVCHYEVQDHIEAKLFAYELVYRLDPVIDGQITGLSISQSAFYNLYRPAFADADVNEKLEITLYADSVSPKYKMLVPTWRDLYTSPIAYSAQRRGDATAPEVQTLYNLLRSPTLAGHPFNLVDSRGALVLTGIHKTFFKFRKSRGMKAG